MASGTTRVQPELKREIGRNLHGATDAQLGQVLALIDAMPTRGSADALIDSLRPRIAKLRPDRKLSLARVLFAPLDTLIVSPRDWRPGMITLPRSLLTFLSAPVLASVAELELETSLLAHSTADSEAVLAIGQRLWSIAAPVIEALPTPSEWRSQTGLPETEWTALRDDAACILARAVQIEAAVQDDAGEDALQGLFTSTATCSPSSIARLVHVLLGRHPRPAEIMAVLSRFGGSAWRAAAEAGCASAAEGAVGLFERAASHGSGAAVGAQLAVMLDAIDSPVRRRRVREIRTRVSAACHDELANLLQRDVISALAAPEPGDAQIEAVERSAREAFKLDVASRALDAQSGTQALLRSAATDIIARRIDGLDDVERVRLIEILLGPEEALAAAGRLQV